MTTAYRAPAEVSERAAPPPRCMCWADAETKAIFNPVGGWFHSSACEDYQRRHPEFIMPVRRLVFSTERPWIYFKTVDWRWSKEAVALYWKALLA